MPAINVRIDRHCRFYRLFLAIALVILGQQAPSFADSTVVFNEIMYHPVAGEASLEWVELHNQMGVNMDLSGWSIAGGVAFTFPEGTIVPGGGFVVVAISPSALATESGFTDALGPFVGRLANDGERLELRNNSDRVMDWIDYRDDSPWPPGADGAGVSLAKVDPELASPHAENWRASAVMGGTPGGHNFGQANRAPYVTLVPINAEWRYEASGIDLGQPWRTTAFDDSRWPTASALFYRVEESVPTIWIGEGNRTSPQDFGLSVSTNFARGVTPGELGGHIERFPAAWYGDAAIGGIDLATHDLSATVRWVQDGHGNPMMGYFQSTSYGTGGEPSGLFFGIDDLNLYLFARVAGGSSTEQFVGSLSAGMQHTITMTWTAATSTWTVTLDGGSAESTVVPDAGMLTLDRFGLFSLGRGGGSGVTVWVDDLEYTVATPELSQRVQVFGSLGPPVGSRFELPRGPTTYYFRTTFDVDDPSDGANVLMQLVAQDGAVVYLNGVEVFRHNMPLGDIAYTTSALSDGLALNAVDPVRLPAEIMRTGANVLAVETHVAPTDDLDVAFGAWLYVPAKTIQPVPRSALMFSELPSTSDSPFWVELSNQGASPIDLSGQVLVGVGDVGGEYVLPTVTIPAGGYLTLTEVETGFRVADGDKLFLLSSTRDVLIDAVVASDSPRARRANGLAGWLHTAFATPGAVNRFELNDDIVINEIMYHQRPVQESLQPSATGTSYRESPEAWIELYNRGGQAVDLTGWTLTDAVDFEFAAGTVLGPGDFLLVAKDLAYLQALHPDVHIAGEFERNLSFTSDHIVLVDHNGNPADRVRYFDGGYWHDLADGGGSSLELRDPRADNSRPEAWAPSDESDRSTWNTYVYRGIATSVVPGEDPADSPSLWMGFLDGAGELLLDDVSVIQDPRGTATQLIPSGTFDDGPVGAWVFSGNHHGEITDDPDDPGNQVLRLVSVGPTEYVFNHVYIPLREVAPDGVEYEISFRARWLAGAHQIHTRLNFNRLPKTTRIDVPDWTGTPGKQNSRHATNIGPTFEGLRHFPVTPSEDQPVTVSVSASDPDGLTSATLWWTADHSPWRQAAMTLGMEGQYLGTIPGQASGTVVQFYVEAQDRRNSGGFSPPTGPESRALYVVEDGQSVDGGAVHTFRTIMLPSEAQLRYDQDNARSNARMGGTAVWNARQPYYDVGVRLRASVRSGRENPEVGLNVQFQPDHLFRGIHETVNIDRDAHGALGIKEILLLHVVNHAGHMPGMYNDLVQSIGPLPQVTSRAMLRMAGQGDVFLESQFEDGDDGTIFESEYLFVDVDFMDLGDNKEFYRWNFGIKNNRTKDDYSGLIALAKTLGMPAGAALEARAAEVMDVSEWMRVFAMMALGGVADTYLQDGNHNIRVYTRPGDGRALAFPWDMDGAFKSSPLPWGDGNLTKVIERAPYTRMYYGHMHDMISTTFNTAYMSYWTEHYGELGSEDFGYVLDFIADRTVQVERLLPPQVSFEVTSESSATVASDTETIQLEGTAWINVKEVRVDGRPEPLELSWTDLQTWRGSISLASDVTEITLRAYDYQGREVAIETINSTPKRAIRAVLHEDPLRVGRRDPHCS